MKKQFCLFLAAILLISLHPGSCADNIDAKLTGKTKLTTDFFGTVSAMYVWDDFSDPAAERRFQSVWEEAKELLNEIENVMVFDVLIVNKSSAATFINIGPSAFGITFEKEV